MKKRIVSAVTLAFLVAVSTTHGQSVITDSDGNISSIPTTDPSIISNIALLEYELHWQKLDYQAAIYNEFHDSDRFVLQGTVQQILKNPDGGFTYFVYLSNWNSFVDGNISDEAAIVTTVRVKGLDVKNNGIFYCQYAGTEKFLSTSNLTGVESQIELPIFKALLYGLKVTDFFELVKTGTPQSVQTAISNGADVKARDDYGGTALTRAAAFNQNPGVITVLLKAGADINAQDLDGSTLMIAAKYNQNPEVVTTLLKAGADVNAHNNLGETPLMNAARYNQNPEVITVLLKAGADINARDGRFTVLMNAAYYNPNPKVITTLLKAGADVNAHNEDGETPLMLAAGNNENPEVITVLLKAGANAKAKNERGHTAFDYAWNGKLKGTDAYKQLQEASQ